MPLGSESVGIETTDQFTIRLGEIHTACLQIQPLIEHFSRVDFIQDKIAVREVARNLRLIRKAARRIPYNIREMHSEIRWERLSAVQIVFFHEYYGIDVDAIWEIFQKTIGEFVEELGSVFNQNPNFKIQI